MMGIEGKEAESSDLSAASITVSVKYSTSGYPGKIEYFAALKLPIDPYSSPEERRLAFRSLFAETRRAVTAEALADKREASGGSAYSRKDGVLG